MEFACNFIEKLQYLFATRGEIILRDNYLNAAILLLLIFKDGEYHFVFEKRSRQIRQGSEICFPGGLFDSCQDENFQQTALRETQEELSVPAESVQILGTVGSLVTPHGILVEGFLGLGGIDYQEIKANPQEVAAVFTVPVSFFAEQPPEQYQMDVFVHPACLNEEGQEEILFPARELNLPEKYHHPWRGRKHYVYVYKWQDEVIWGITAAFLYSFMQRIKEL